MCYSPIDIVNPSKYVSLTYHDPYIMQVPCGKCAACMTLKSSEWSFRLYHEALDTFGNGFCLFDTLTYDDAHLPHISDFISVPDDLDYPCFSAVDLRLFVANLRQCCKRYFGSNFRYFIVSEYGTSEMHLHRPHYHALFFVRGNIKPLEFSRLVSKCWNRGRTDGVPFRPASHVIENSFNCLSAGALRSFNYVTKYIQKSCKFQKEINARIDFVMKSVSKRFDEMGLDWSSSSHYWRLRELLSRRVNQFHRQSSHLGECALRDMDIDDIFQSGSLKMPDNHFVVKSIPLPTYFKRKLFYQLYDVDGSQTWQPTDLGYQYIETRISIRLKLLIDRLKALANHVSIPFDFVELADYIVNHRGRFGSGLPSRFTERINQVSLFNYSNRYDKEWFGRTGLVTKFVGNSSSGFSRVKPKFIPISDFIRQNVYFNEEYEKVLESVSNFRSEIDVGRQKLFEYQQRLGNMIHHFFG